MMGMLNLADIAAAERQEMRKAGTFIAIFGGMITVLGIAAFVFVGVATMFSVLFVGWVFLVSGIAEVAHAVFRRGWSGFWPDLLSGVISALAGLFIVLHPIAGVAFFTVLIGVVFLVGGLLRVGLGIGLRSPYRGWLVLHGVVSALLGGMILAEWPDSAIWVIGTLVAVDLVVSGVRLLTFGLAARQLPAAESDDRPAISSAPPSAPLG